MSLKTISATIVGVILITAVALYLRHEPQRGEAESLQAAQPRTPAPAAASNDAAPRSDATGPRTAPLPPANAPASIPETPDELKLPPVPEILETERAFAAEPVDPVWSHEAETRILDEVAEMTGLKLVTLRVECKTTLCRLHVSRREMSSANPFPQLAGRVGLKPLWIVGAVDRNGVPTSLAYFERASPAR